MTTQREALHAVIAASLGVINVVLLDQKDYNPDQPRDEMGRFGSGGSSRPSSSARPSAAGAAKQFDRMRETAKAAGFPPEKIVYAGAGGTREINGETFYQTATFDSNTGDIRVYDASLDDSRADTMHAVIAHEMEHAKWEAIGPHADEDEYKQMRQDRKAHPDWFDDDKRPLPAHADKYPANKVMGQFYGPGSSERLAEMRSQGGVDEYSNSYWEKGNDSLAFQETIAAVAGLDAEGKGDQVPAYWRQQYNDVQAAYQAATGSKP